MQTNAIYTAELGNLFSSNKDGMLPQIETTSMKSKGKKKKFFSCPQSQAYCRGRVQPVASSKFLNRTDSIQLARTS
jgi:hypothetical protein